MQLFVNDDINFEINLVFLIKPFLGILRDFLFVIEYDNSKYEDLIRISYFTVNGDRGFSKVIISLFIIFYLTRKKY